jgi:hypothetical protein
MGVEMRSHVVAPLEIRGHPQSAFIEFRETGHMSFSDAPFVMPDTITRFGGELLDALRTREILSRILLAFLGEQLQGSEDTIADVAEEFEEIALIRPVHRRTSAP